MDHLDIGVGEQNLVAIVSLGDVQAEAAALLFPGSSRGRRRLAGQPPQGFEVNRADEAGATERCRVQACDSKVKNISEFDSSPRGPIVACF